LLQPPGDSGDSDAGRKVVRTRLLKGGGKKWVKGHSNSSRIVLYADGSITKIKMAGLKKLHRNVCNRGASPSRNLSLGQSIGSKEEKGQRKGRNICRPDTKEGRKLKYAGYRSLSTQEY